MNSRYQLPEQIICLRIGICLTKQIDLYLLLQLNEIITFFFLNCGERYS